MFLEGLKRLLGRRGRSGDAGAAEAREMLSCEESLARLQEFVDGELDGLTHEQVEAHFEVCTRCYPHLTLEKSFRERVRAALNKPDVPADLRERVLSRLAQDDGDVIEG